LAFSSTSKHFGDVLEIDAAERRLERDDDVDELVDVQFRDFNVEHVDAGEFLEQNRLAFHHRLGRERPDRSKAEHSRSVGQHRDEILARGERRRGVGVGGDRLAGKGDARRIGERQVALIGERLGGDDLELAGPRLAVELQGVRFEIGRAFLGHFAPPSYRWKRLSPNRGAPARASPEETPGRCFSQPSE